MNDIFNEKYVKAKLQRLEQANQSKRQRIQDATQHKKPHLSRLEYEKYKKILFEETKKPVQIPTTTTTPPQQANQQQVVVAQPVFTAASSSDPSKKPIPPSPIPKSSSQKQQQQQFQSTTLLNKPDGQILKPNASFERTRSPQPGEIAFAKQGDLKTKKKQQQAPSQVQQLQQQQQQQQQQSIKNNQFLSQQSTPSLRSNINAQSIVSLASPNYQQQQQQVLYSQQLSQQQFSQQLLPQAKQQQQQPLRPSKSPLMHRQSAGAQNQLQQLSVNSSTLPPRQLPLPLPLATETDFARQLGASRSTQALREMISVRSYDGSLLNTSQDQIYLLPSTGNLPSSNAPMRNSVPFFSSNNNNNNNNNNQIYQIPGAAMYTQFPQQHTSSLPQDQYFDDPSLRSATHFSSTSTYNENTPFYNQNQENALAYQQNHMSSQQILHQNNQQKGFFYPVSEGDTMNQQQQVIPQQGFRTGNQSTINMNNNQNSVSLSQNPLQFNSDYEMISSNQNFPAAVSPANMFVGVNPNNPNFFQNSNQNIQSVSNSVTIPTSGVSSPSNHGIPVIRTQMQQGGGGGGVPVDSTFPTRSSYPFTSSNNETDFDAFDSSPLQHLGVREEVEASEELIAQLKSNQEILLQEKQALERDIAELSNRSRLFQYQQQQQQQPAMSQHSRAQHSSHHSKSSCNSSILTQNVTVTNINNNNNNNNNNNMSTISSQSSSSSSVLFEGSFRRPKGLHAVAALTQQPHNDVTSLDISTAEFEEKWNLITKEEEESEKSFVAIASYLKMQPGGGAHRNHNERDRSNRSRKLSQNSSTSSASSLSRLPSEHQFHNNNNNKQVSQGNDADDLDWLDGIDESFSELKSINKKDLLPFYEEVTMSKKSFLDNKQNTIPVDPYTKLKDTILSATKANNKFSSYEETPSKEGNRLGSFSKKEHSMGGALSDSIASPSFGARNLYDSLHSNSNSLQGSSFSQQQQQNSSSKKERAASLTLPPPVGSTSNYMNNHNNNNNINQISQPSLAAKLKEIQRPPSVQPVATGTTSVNSFSRFPSKNATALNSNNNNNNTLPNDIITVKMSTSHGEFPDEETRRQESYLQMKLNEMQVERVHYNSSGEGDVNGNNSSNINNKYSNNNNNNLQGQSGNFFGADAGRDSLFSQASSSYNTGEYERARSPLDLDRPLKSPSNSSVTNKLPLPQTSSSQSVWQGTEVNNELQVSDLNNYSSFRSELKLSQTGSSSSVNQANAPIDFNEFSKDLFMKKFNPLNPSGKQQKSESIKGQHESEGDSSGDELDNAVNRKILMMRNSRSQEKLNQESGVVAPAYAQVQSQLPASSSRGSSRGATPRQVGANSNSGSAVVDAVQKHMLQRKGSSEQRTPRGLLEDEPASSDRGRYVGSNAKQLVSPASNSSGNVTNSKGMHGKPEEQERMNGLPKLSIDSLFARNQNSEGQGSKQQPLTQMQQQANPSSAEVSKPISVKDKISNIQQRLSNLFQKKSPIEEESQREDRSLALKNIDSNISEIPNNDIRRNYLQLQQQADPTQEYLLSHQSEPRIDREVIDNLAEEVEMLMKMQNLCHNESSFASDQNQQNYFELNENERINYDDDAFQNSEQQQNPNTKSRLLHSSLPLYEIQEEHSIDSSMLDFNLQHNHQ